MTTPSLQTNSSPMIPDQPRTIKRGGGRQWLHPTRVKGRYQTLRTISTIALLAFMFAAPWLTIGGLPFIRLSFLAESFYLLGQPILIYEFYHFVQLALLLVVTLFLASAYFGRIWCGYACPQTIFIEQIFERIQTLIEGPAAHRIATQNAPMTTARLLRKIVKQAAFLAVSAAFGFNLVAIFVGPENIFASTAAVTVALLLTALAWFDSAYWREQFCHIACPYARFQSVMQDLNTRTIGYDAKRGEPRRKGKQRDGAGDCIDCGLCTRVCPSGIDIRQGASQLECTGCARCVDACDNVMATIKKPSGLIRYDKLHVFESPSQKSSEVPPSKRPRRLRQVVYATIWVTLFGTGVWQFVNRRPFHARLTQLRTGSPYFLSGETIRNTFAIKVGNQSRHAEMYSLTADGVTLETANSTAAVLPGREAVIPVVVSGNQAAVGSNFTIRIQNANGFESTLTKTFVGPDLEKPKS